MKKYEYGIKIEKKFNRTDASKIAKKIIEDMGYEKKLVHFWVFQYSFLSEDSLIKVDGFE